MRLIVILIALAFSGAALAEQKVDNSDVPAVTPNQLKEFPFQQNGNEKAPKVTELTFSQEFILKQDRKDIKATIARYLGILDLHGDKRDLSTLQQLVNKNVLKKSQVKKWQEVGVVFGDILANEFGLHWVSYEDDKGMSTALQWKNTQNFVFPVTMFSRRLEYENTINVRAVYDKIAKEIREFKAYENKLPKMPKESH